MVTWSRFNIASIVFGFAFLYMPIVLLVIFSFNESKLVTVWAGFSTKWYVQLLHNQALLDAAWVTVRVGLISATVATVLGTLAALAMTRYTRFRGRMLFSGMIYAPLVMPEVITGLSMLLLFVAVGLDRGFWTLTLAHITFTMCFVAVVVQSRLLSFDRSIEEAAHGPGRHAGRHLSASDLAGHRAGRLFRLGSRLHAIAGRSGDLELHLRPGGYHAADEDLQSGAVGCDAGNQRSLHHSDRHRCDGCARRFRRLAAPGNPAGQGRAGGVCLVTQVALLQSRSRSRGGRKT